MVLTSLSRGVIEVIGTGIPKLDDYLKGGIPTGKSLVYYSSPGVEGNVFGMQTLYYNLREGRKCVFIASSSDPLTVRDMFQEFGWDIGEFEDNFFIIDAYSGLIGAASDERYVVEDPEDIDSFSMLLKKVFEELGSDATFMFESLSTMMDLCGEDEIISAVGRWNRWCVEHGHILIYNFTAWPYKAENLEKIRSDLFNAVIAVGGIAQRVIFGQYFGVVKADWGDVHQLSMLFRILRPGGIKIFIPKILVTGPFNAGKTTFVHKLSNRAVSVDRIGTTVALDHGHVEYKGFSADIFGTPGQERFDPIIKMLSGEAMGIILVVDSTNKKDFVRAKQMLDITMRQGLPLIVAANKQDLQNALGPDEIRQHFNLPADVDIVPVVSTSGEGVKEVFEVLVDKIVDVV